MTSQEKLDYIYLTLKSFQELLPKTENVVLDVNDDKLHQLSARTLISLDFATSILPPPDQMITKTWVIRLEIEIDENSHPRKFIPEAINECLNLEEGEDLIDYSFICID